MDEEIKKMLVHVLEGQEEIKIEIKNEISKVKDEIAKLGATIDGELIPTQ